MRSAGVRTWPASLIILLGLVPTSLIILMMVMLHGILAITM